MPEHHTSSPSPVNRSHVTPSRPIDNGLAPQPHELPFWRFGILLPILMLAMIPALILLYIGKAAHSQIIFTIAEVLTLILIFGSSVILIVSGILGALAYRKQRRLMHGLHKSRHRSPQQY